MHLNEAEYIFEVVDPGTDQPASEGELVITNLGRAANPAIRYRTGDLVRLVMEPCACGRGFPRLDGGVVGRVDDMLIVRAVNVFPSALENIVRRFDGVTEFVVELYREHEMDELEIRLETLGADGDRILVAIENEVHTQIGFRPQVSIAPPGSLPRFELKARRVFDRRQG